MSLASELIQRKLDWIIPQWPAPDNVRALFTTRNGGFSEGACATMNLARSPDSGVPHVAQNLALLHDVIGVNPVWLSQVHGTDVLAIDNPPPMPVGDAAVATRPGRAAAVRVADCLPVLFCDRAGTQVAAAHAGWRGLAAGVLEATVAAMHVEPQELIAWFGPAIGPDAFEVGDDVRDTFLQHDAESAAAFSSYPARPGKWLADLFMLASMRLSATGLTDHFGGGICTVSNPDRFFSHRRDKTPGRMAALIWLER
ncbi:MAG: peptidoglycan editing factor PgeF [Betaproteobacteria bacterium]